MLYNCVVVPYSKYTHTPSHLTLHTLFTPLPHRCTGCISSGINKCRWCPFSHQCIPDRNPFQCSGSSQEVTIGQNDQCPQITAGSYLVHVDHTYDNPPLRITTSNLSTFRSQFDLGQFE